MLKLEEKGLSEMGRKKELTKKEFEKLLTKASQPVEQGQKPDSSSKRTSESPTSGDCSGTDTR